MRQRLPEEKEDEEMKEVRLRKEERESGISPVAEWLAGDGIDTNEEEQEMFEVEEKEVEKKDEHAEPLPKKRAGRPKKKGKK